MKRWELSQAQVEARAKRLDVERLDAAIANMTDVLAEALAFEGEFTDHLQEIRNKMFTIRSRRYPIQTDSAGTPPVACHPRPWPSTPRSSGNWGGPSENTRI